MMKNLNRSHMAIALSLLLASGCQAPTQLHQLKQPWFALGEAEAPVPVTPVTKSAPTTAVGGQLTVSFSGELARLTQKRRVQATVADVEKVVVTVRPTGAAEVSKTVLKAALTAGQTSVTFDGLPPGAAEVVISAFDLYGANIGTATRSATVSAGQTATVAVTVQLSPTFASGAGGGATPSTGGLATNVLIQDGPVVTSMAGGGVLEKFVMPFVPLEIASNGDDDIWVTGWTGTTDVLAKLSTTGVIERVIDGVEGLDSYVCVDAQGDAWVALVKGPGNRVLTEFSAEGKILSERPLAADHVIGGTQMRMDGEGNVYYFGGPMAGGTRQAPDGTTVRINTTGSTVAAGTLDDLWVGVFSDPAVDAEKPTSFVVRYSKSGAELGRYSVGAGYRSAYTAIDQQGNAWVTALRSDFSPGATPLKGRLVKFSPQGQQLGAFELTDGEMAEAVEIGSDGRIWVLSSASAITDGSVTWFDSTGLELGHVPVDNLNQWQFAAAKNGAWVIGGSQFDRTIYHVAP